VSGRGDAEAREAAAPAPSVRDVFGLWAPTALSTSLLVVELPVVTALLARGTQGEQSLAAFGIALGVLVVVNAPALSLTAATVSLARSGAQFRAMRNYALLIGAATTGLLLMLTVGPGGGVLTAVTGVDGDTGLLVRQGLGILSLAPLAVAWRRLQQGILIHTRHTLPITVASLVRVAVTVVVSTGLLIGTDVAGVVVGAGGLLAGACSEAAAVTWAARRYGGIPAAGGDGLAFRRVVRFHLPVAAATLITMLPQGLVAAGMARGQASAESLAAWPVVYGLMSLFTGPTTDLESVTASVRRDSPGERSSLRLARRLALVLSATFALIAVSPIGVAYVQDFSGAPDGPADVAVAALPWLALAPGLWALRAYARGALLAADRPGRVQVAAVAGLATLACVLLGGATLEEVSALVVGCLALVCALAVELAVLTSAAPRRADSAAPQEGLVGRDAGASAPGR
jgi:hypothetical protein